MNLYKIYVHVNKINNKIYIGQTNRKNVYTRFGKNGIQYKKCPYFWNAIKKYGWNQFKHIVLFENLTSEMANLIEIELIKKYKSNIPDYGYNLAKGGSNGTGECLKKEVFQYTINGDFVRKWKSATDAAQQLDILASNIGQCCRGISMTCNGFVWAYTKLNKEYFININNPYCKKIKQYDERGNYIQTFNSGVEASKETGINTCLIYTSCQKNGRNTTNGKYRWTYEDVDIDKAMINGQTKQRKVCQYDLKGNKIKTWDSIHTASETLKIAHEKIVACCRYKQKTSGGFIWRYAYENLNSIANIDEYLKKRETNNHIKRSNKQTKRIAQYSLDNIFIREWDSSSEATAYYGGAKNTTNIQACCRGNKKTAYGFIWKYIN